MMGERLVTQESLFYEFRLEDHVRRLCEEVHSNLAYRCERS